MIHLANKVYLSSDSEIDVDIDRIVISKEHGNAMLQSVIDGGALIKYGDTLPYTSFDTMFNEAIDHCKLTDLPLVIYADDEEFNKTIAAWYKLILVNPSEDSVNALIKLQLFKLKTFNNINVPFINSYDIEVSGSIDTSKHSVELLLASYLANSSYKDTLKSTLKPLIRKSIELYLLEARENYFMSLGGVMEIEATDPVFTSTSIWNTDGLVDASSNSSNINFESITSEDAQYITNSVHASLESFTNCTGTTQVNMLQYLTAITGEFSDELLDTLLTNERNVSFEDDSVFSLSIGTVNKYLIRALFNDASLCEQYSVKL